MNKQFLTTFLLLSTITFFSTLQIQSSYIKNRQPSKAQLLQHLKNVRFTLQKHLKIMHDRWEELLMDADDCESQEDIEEIMGMIFASNLCEDFYKNSISIQQKVSELVTPAFNFICHTIKPLIIDEITRHLHSYTKSKFDKNTTKQLQTLLQSLYIKHYQIHRNKNPHIKLTEVTQTPIDELYEGCLWVILGTNDLAIYESTVLLQKIDAKIKEIESSSL
ncbi:MAG TPA: hypothetical protein VHX42_02995 [Candidatus Babeliales bacterium]|nr:hypothetical protein [Candidatus Babeliales bacterium]